MVLVRSVSRDTPCIRLSRSSTTSIPFPPPSGQAHVIVSVHKHLHVEHVPQLHHVQHEDAFDDDDVCWEGSTRVCAAAVRREVVDRDIVWVEGLCVGCSMGAPCGGFREGAGGRGSGECTLQR
jgi:hypothetical protein